MSVAPFHPTARRRDDHGGRAFTIVLQRSDVLLDNPSDQESRRRRHPRGVRSSSFEREPRLVLDDVHEGLVTREAAGRDYAVAIGADDEVDLEGTAAFRPAAL